MSQQFHELLSYREGVARQESPQDGTAQCNSIGPRLVFWENTWQVIRQHPVLGAGTGDFPAEYETVRRVRTPNHWQNVDNPHNMYLMIWSQSGLVGLGVVLALFGALLLRARRRFGVSSKITTGLVCFFLLIMMSDAYLQLSNISLLFALFIAIGAEKGGEAELPKMGDRCGGSL